MDDIGPKGSADKAHQYIPDAPRVFDGPKGIYITHYCGGKYAVGWFAHSRKRPDQFRYVVCRGASRILDRFPYDSEGWFAAWNRFLDLEPGADQRIAQQEQANVTHNRLHAGDSAPLSTLADYRSTHVGRCMLLGGYGYPLVPNVVYQFDFGQECASISDASRRTLSIPYGDFVALEIGGKGAVTTGGRFIGGGFGVAGAIQGMALASIVNALTKKTKVMTLIRLTTHQGDLIFHHDVETPDSLRIRLMPVFGKIKDAKQDDSVAPSVSDSVERLVKLADLLDRGLLTPDEFNQAKAKLFGNI